MSYALFASLISTCGFFVWVGRLSGTEFVFSILLSGLAAIGLHNVDSVRHFALKGAGIEATLAIEKIRDDLYAKAEEVHRLAEEFAGMLAERAAGANRLVGDDLDTKLITYRERLKQTLDRLGTSKARQLEIVQPITKMMIVAPHGEAQAGQAYCSCSCVSSAR